MRLSRILRPLLAAALTATSLITTAPAADAAYTINTDRFIKAVAPAAQRAHKEFRVPASVTIAQSILESGWGTSTLSRYGHAYFGIKCKTDYTSPYQLGCMDKSSLEYFDPSNPVAIVSAFRTYRSSQDSFADHGYFLKNSPRYAAAFSTTNPDDFIREVGRAGYATDPGYADQIIGIMGRYSLYRYDIDPIDATPIPVDGAIGDLWRSMGAANSRVGFAIGAEQDSPIDNTADGGRSLPFDRGMIMWSPATGAHSLDGALWDAYRFSQHTRDQLRYATSQPYAARGGIVQRFSGGALVYANGQTFPVWGEIGRKWAAMGAENGRLGLPTSGEFCGLVGGGCFQRFTDGAIYWSPATGAHTIWGRIQTRWADFQWEYGRLGYPTSDEMCGLVGGGCWQTFERGRMYWSPASDAHPLWGAIGERFDQMGYEHGPLGYPTRAEFCGLKDGGCFQDFQGGSIHWSPATGAWTTWGAIREFWASTGWENGRFGYPTGPEQCATPGGVFTCTQQFAGGTIHYQAGRGAY